MLQATPATDPYSDINTSVFHIVKKNGGLQVLSAKLANNSWREAHLWPGYCYFPVSYGLGCTELESPTVASTRYTHRGSVKQGIVTPVWWQASVYGTLYEKFILPQSFIFRHHTPRSRLSEN